MQEVVKLIDSNDHVLVSNGALFSQNLETFIFSLYEKINPTVSRNSTNLDAFVDIMGDVGLRNTNFSEKPIRIVHNLYELKSIDVSDYNQLLGMIFGISSRCYDEMSIVFSGISL